MSARTAFGVTSPAWPGSGICAPHPGCSWCTWVWAATCFKLKYANAACPQHSHLLKAGA